MRLFQAAPAQKLQHRIVMAPLTRVRGNDDFSCGPTAVQYYSERATRGAFFFFFFFFPLYLKSMKEVFSSQKAHRSPRKRSTSLRLESTRISRPKVGNMLLMQFTQEEGLLQFSCGILEVRNVVSLFGLWIFICFLVFFFFLKKRNVSCQLW